MREDADASRPSVARNRRKDVGRAQMQSSRRASDQAVKRGAGHAGRQSRTSASERSGRTAANAASGQRHRSPAQRRAEREAGSAGQASRSSASYGRHARPAVTTGAAQDDNRASRHEQKQRQRLKQKADRQYERAAAKDYTPEETGSRAAVHRGAMGSRQRKASRMHAETSAYSGAAQVAMGGLSGLKNFVLAFVDSFTSGKRSMRFYVAFVSFICVICIGLFLYPNVKDYYTAVRNQAKSQAEYEALQEYYEELQDDVAYMDTDEGVEDAARSKYGWTKSDENGVLVQGVQSESDFDETDIGIVPEGSIKAPDTWYSGILDPFFGYEG